MAQLLPALRQLRIDLVHFGVVMVVNVMIGLHRSPSGMLPFGIDGLTGSSLRGMSAEIWPVLTLLIAALLVLVLAPETVLGLPRPFGRGG